MFFITCLSFFVSSNATDPVSAGIEVDEEFSPEIGSIRSIEEFEDRIRAEIAERELSGIDIPILVDDYVRNKFYNEYSYIPWHDNWVLALVDNFFPTLYLTGHMRPE